MNSGSNEKQAVSKNSKRPKLYFNWSTGKDSALALHHLLQAGTYEIDLLLTTVNSHHNRVSMHGLPRELLLAQVKALGIPATTVELPEQPSMEDYSRIFTHKITELKQANYTHCAFGDIFLEDLRVYREKQLAPSGIQAVFPLWKRNTRELLLEFIDLGFKAVVICASAEHFGADFVGRSVDRAFLEDLPAAVDPCGENGEFHTFCYDGPIFQQAVPFEIGETIRRNYPNPSGKGEVGFWFGDLKNVPK